MAGSGRRGPTLAKDINRKLVYSALKQRRSSTRVELASALGLNKNTINTIVDELIEAGYVKETGLLSRSGAGRKAVGLSFASDRRRAIGLQLLPDKLRGVVTDLYASPLQSIEVPLSGRITPERVADAVAECVAKWTGDEDGDRFAGIGLGVPALLDPARSRIIGSSHLGWIDVPLQEQLRSSLPLPVLLDNSVKLASLGELWHGSGQGAGHFAYCSFGVGVGCGLVIGGEMVRGESGVAGELGHVVVESEGPRCSCGNLGCLEAVVGLPAIFSRLEAATGHPRSAMDEVWLAEQARLGHEAVLGEIDRVGRAIGHALSVIVNLLNPKLLICDGPLMQLSRLLFPVIREELARKALSYSRIEVNLVRSALYPLAGSIGAAASAIAAWERQSDPLDRVAF